MLPALELMRSRKFQGWIAAALAFGASYLIARIPGLLDFAETDILHGHSLLTVATLSLFLFVAAPHRGRNLAGSLLHGVALGSSLWWLCHFLLHADLADRNDILLVILHALLLAMVVATLGVSSLVIAAIFRFWLRRNRIGSGPLQVLEVVLSGQVSRADGNSLPDWIRRVLLAYHRLRRAIGRDTARSYAIEKAFHASLDETSLALRRALESRADTEVLDRSNEVAAAAAAELEMIGLLRRFHPNLPDVPDWPSRLLKSWDLIRWAEWTVLKPAPDARGRLLGAIIASPVISPWLSSAARAVLNRQTSTHLTGQIAKHIRPDASGEELFGNLLLVEGLVDADLVTWANDFLEQQSNHKSPAWFTPALARIRMQAEAQMLRHETALGPEETAVRRATYSSFLLQSDPPTLTAETRAELAPPLRELTWQW